MSGASGGRPWVAWVVVAGALTAGLAGLHFYLTAEAPAPGARPSPEGTPAALAAPGPAAPPTPTEAPPRPDLPALDESDAWLRTLAATLSANPKFAAWLASDRLVRRFVAVIDNVAEGKSPKPHLLFLEPEGRFRLSRKSGRTFVDPASHARYDRTVDVVESLDAAGMAELYRSVKPLVDQAYRDLGYPTGSFDDKLAAAIRALLAVPVVDGPLEIAEARATTWRYVDPRLEELTPAQRQLLRTGPKNVARVQAKLREIEEALALPTSGTTPAG